MGVLELYTDEVREMLNKAVQNIFGNLILLFLIFYISHSILDFERTSTSKYVSIICIKINF